MKPYHNDPTLKIGYDPVIHKVLFDRVGIGPQGWISIPTVTGTPTDANSIFCNSSTGLDTNPGTLALPKATLLASMNACTITKLQVVVTNNGYYAESLADLDNIFCIGIFAASGVTAFYTLRTLDYTPTDANTIYVSKAGSDANAGTFALPCLTLTGATGAISKITASKTRIVILDSGTYIENGFTISGNFAGLYAALGCMPTIRCINGTYSSTVSVSETSIGSTNAMNPCSIVMPNGDIAIFTVLDSTTDYLQLTVMDSTFAVIKAATTIYSHDPINSPSACLTASGDIFVAFWITSPAYGYYIIIDGLDYSVKKSITTFNSETTYYPSPVLLENGNIFIVYGNSSNYGRYTVLNGTTYAVITSPTTFLSSTFDVTRATLNSDGNIFIIFRNASYYGQYIILNGTTYSVITSSTTFMSSATFPQSVKQLVNGDYLIAYSDNSDGGHCKYVLLVGSTLSVTTPVEFKASNNRCHASILLDYRIFFVYSVGTGLPYYTVYNLVQHNIIASVPATINGLIFDANNAVYVSRMISASDKITRRYCDMMGVTNDADPDNGFSIYSTAEIDSQFSKIHDCGCGDYTEEDKATFKNNAYYRITQGNALHIKGAAAAAGDILVDHNTFFANKTGLRLENNNGANETVKNNIFHSNDLYDIQATTAITFLNSLYTGVLLNATKGAQVVRLNPRFVNEGSYDPALIDLHLQDDAAGYSIPSPGLNLGDDDKNAGAYDTAAIGQQTTWSYIIILKPEGFDINEKAINPIQLNLDSGDLETSVDAWTEIVKLPYGGMWKTDFVKMMLVMKCGKNKVLIWPDHITYPNDYDVYKIIYGDVEASPKHYLFSALGITKPTFVFGRGSTTHE